MKIVFLHLTIGLNHRGSESVVDTLATGLSAHHDVTVVSGGVLDNKKYNVVRPLRITKAPKSAPQNLWEKIQFRLSADPLSKLVAMFTRSSLENIKAINPDILIPINGSVQLSVLKKHFKSSTLVTFGHAGIGYHDEAILKSSPDLFIALTPQAKNWAMKRAGSTTRVVYLPNPINQDAFTKARRANIELKHPLVISVGALSRYKNHDLTIMAVAKTKASLLIVGKGEEEAGLRSLAGKLMRGRCKIMAVTPREMPGLYQAADSFCLMSDVQESFGVVYAEAMASGLPVVAPSDAIRKGIIGKNGFYSGYEVDDIATAIEKSLGKKPLNYARELEKYDPQKVTAKLEALLIEAKGQANP